jgi:putative oxidoreductase
MNDPFRYWKSWSPQILSLMRIMAGFLFIPSGTMKFFAFPVGMPEGTPPIQPMTQMWFGGWMEIIGGTMILLGILTRPAAFILSGMMAVAYWQFHAPGGFWPIVNQGMPAVLFCFIFLYISAAGPGPWSIDALIKKSPLGDQEP